MKIFLGEHQPSVIPNKIVFCQFPVTWKHPGKLKIDRLSHMGERETEREREREKNRERQR